MKVFKTSLLLQRYNIRFSFLKLLNKRMVQLPSYHPRYKKPDLMWDLELDPKVYYGFWKLFPIPPKSRPACVWFAVMIGFEFIGFIGVYYIVLSDSFLQ